MKFKRKSIMSIILSVMFISGSNIVQAEEVSNESRGAKLIDYKASISTYDSNGRPTIDDLFWGSITTEPHEKLGFKDDYGTLHYVNYRGVEDSVYGKNTMFFDYTNTNAYQKSNYILFTLGLKTIDNKFECIGGYAFQFENVSKDEVLIPIDYTVDVESLKGIDKMYIIIGMYDEVPRADELFLPSNELRKYPFGQYLLQIPNPFDTDYATHWAKTEIENAMKKGWVNDNTNNFYPDRSITRAEFVKIVNKAFGLKSKVYEESFNDVNSNDWWYNEVLIALKAGYITSKNTNFRPNDPITREEVANIITTLTFSKDKNLDKLEKYTDKNQIAASALSSVEGAIEKGFMGVNSTVFRPKSNITRAEAIVTLSRIRG